LLLPLQSDGRSIKPSLVHGDCWDGNTAITVEGRAVFFDVASFYGHNEYDLGDWRAPRHALSDPVYVLEYEKIVPRSAPGTYYL
jgi:protein-ribulosamine 3-kinase